MLGGGVSPLWGCWWRGRGGVSGVMEGEEGVYWRRRGEGVEGREDMFVEECWALVSGLSGGCVRGVSRVFLGGW